MDTKNNNYKEYNFIENNFYELRNQICSSFESIEKSLLSGNNLNLKPGKFIKKSWKRKPDKGFAAGSLVR